MLGWNVLPVASVLLTIIAHFLFDLLFKAVELLRETLRLFSRLNNLLCHYSIVLNIVNLLFYFLYINVLSLLSKDLGILFSFTNFRPSVRIPDYGFFLGLNWGFELVIDCVYALFIVLGVDPLLDILVDLVNKRLAFCLDLNHVLFGKNFLKIVIDLLDVNVVATRFTIRFDKLLLVWIRLCDLLLRFLNRDLELSFSEEFGQALW